MGLVACAGYETGYFKDRVNEATEVMVAKRYGLPHKVEQLKGDQTVWTYFDRGSAHQASPVRPAQPFASRIC
jgi:hypothetical protein